jgi:CHRD domain
VKKIAASSVAVLALATALLGAVGASGAAQATSIRLVTTLDAAQEVPAPEGNVAGARGTFAATATASATGATLEWNLTFAELTGPAVAAHIHTGQRGQAGPVVVPLCGPCQSPASGTANVLAPVLDALENGTAYVNVHTPRNAPGEIRGQVGITANARAALTARQEVPRPKGRVGRARGAFTGTIAKTGTTGSLRWRLTFSRLTGRAVAAHIHTGARGRSGPVVVPLCGPCRTGVRRTVTLQASVLTALEAGRAYVNIHTRRNPAGEIRGQIGAVPLSIS